MGSSEFAFFVTTATHNRRPVFETSRTAELFISTLLELRARGHFKLHAFLVLPDHIHLLLTPRSLPLTPTVDLIKASFARNLCDGNTLWEPDYTSHPVPSMNALETVRHYLHQAPVRANLVPAPELYPYSSAHRLAVTQPA